jgi:hypothetical protein
MESKGFNFAEIPQTAIKVLTSPAQFFKSMPKTGGFVEPLIFMVVMGVIGGLLQSIFSIIGLKIGAGMAMGIASIVIMPIMIAIFGFLGAAILFVIWKLMGSKESYETAYRCAAYVSAITPITTVLGLIPYIGGIIAIAISTYFIVIASIEAHSIPSQKAWLVFGIIGAIFALMGLTAEFAAHKLSRQGAQFQQQMKEASELMQKQAEQMQKSSEGMSAEMQRQMQEAQKAMEKQMKKDKEE